MIKPDRIGHLVVKVRNLDRALVFYTEILGLTIMNRSSVEGINVAFLASNARDHHELGLLEIGNDAVNAESSTVGMDHFAFRLRSQSDLEAAYRELKNNHVEVSFTVTHGVTDSIYLVDPDGNQLEIYVDNSPEVFSKMPNAYMGTEKLSFAPDDNGIIDAISERS